MFVIKALLMLLFPFYRVEFPVDAYPSQFTYIEYKNGREVGRQNVPGASSTLDELNKLLRTEKDGWRYNLVDYAPSHLFSAPTMSINCLDGAIVVNYQEGTSWIQISKDIKTSCPIVSISK